MIDDMEDGNSMIAPNEGRQGYWSVYNDGTSTGFETPLSGSQMIPDLIPGGNGASTRAMHTYGGGFVLWGAVMQFDLHKVGPLPSPYNASTFTGITFWVKGPSPKSIVLNFKTAVTDAPDEGGNCASNCGDHYAAQVSLTDDWVQVVVPFSSLAQNGFGPAAWAPDQLLQINFQAVSGTFDFWIDDIGFYH